MTLAFTERAWEEYCNWQRLDRKTQSRVNAILKDVVRTPYEGIGKPEPLKHELAGWWSRRIDNEHRLVYRVVGESVEIAQCMHHY